MRILDWFKTVWTDLVKAKRDGFLVADFGETRFGSLEEAIAFDDARHAIVNAALDARKQPSAPTLPAATRALKEKYRTQPKDYGAAGGVVAAPQEKDYGAAAQSKLGALLASTGVSRQRGVSNMQATTRSAPYEFDNGPAVWSVPAEVFGVGAGFPEVRVPASDVERFGASAQRKLGDMLVSTGAPLHSPVTTEYLVVQDDLWLAWRDDQIKRVEGLRRERHTLGAAPVKGLVDYSAAGQAVTTAMAALDEGLPNGQKERCEAALVLAREGLKQLEAWMSVKGYDTQKRL